MKLTRTTYPDVPGHPGDPCWQLSGRYFYVDADWNTRFPFGTSFSLTVGPRHGKSPFRTAAGFLLDLNPPLGEPDRLHLHAAGWHVTVGLLPGTGLDRYRYHRSESGRWTRNAEPEPMHWGWLTVERTRKR